MPVVGAVHDPDLFPANASCEQESGSHTHFDIELDVEVLAFEAGSSQQCSLDPINQSRVALDGFPGGDHLAQPLVGVDLIEVLVLDRPQEHRPVDGCDPAGKADLVPVVPSTDPVGSLYREGELTIGDHLDEFVDVVVLTAGSTSSYPGVVQLTCFFLAHVETNQRVAPLLPVEEGPLDQYGSPVKGMLPLHHDLVIHFGVPGILELDVD